MVDSIVIDPAAASLIVEAEFPIVVDVAKDTVLRVRYEPLAIETMSASVILYTNAFGVPFAVDAHGTSIPPDTITVSVPTDIASRPGQR